MQIIPQTQSEYDPNAVETFLTSLRHTDDGCTEIRILPKERYLQINGKREYVGNTVAGYYTDYAQVARDIAPFDGRGNIYATLNPCDKKLMRRTSNRLEFNVKTTAADKDITKVLWFPFDTDPIRPTGTSANDDELQAALERRDQIITEVFEPFGVPVIRAMSGNGGHGLIPLIGYPNTTETQAAIKRLLNWLKETYSDKVVSVDSTIANPARIWKVYGTLACKGDNTPEAPYRRAFIELPDEPIEPFDLLAIIDQIVPADFQSADESAKKKQSTTRPMNGEKDYLFLDVAQYLSHYDHSFSTKQKDGRIIYVLNCCPFNPNHNRGEACITQEANGKLGFKCFHDSCSKKGWSDAKSAIGNPKIFYQGIITKRWSSEQNGNNKASQPKPPDFDAIREQIGNATVLDGDEKTEAVKAIIKQMVNLEPVNQSTFIEKMKQVGLGSKATLESQLKASRRVKYQEQQATQRTESDSSLPEINTTNRHLRNITQDALNSLIQQNESPRIFVRGGVLVRIKPYESSTIVSEVLTTHALRGELARAANFVGGENFMGQAIHQPISPPIDVVNDLMALPQWQGISTLKEVIHAPVFTEDGTFNTSVGYQPKSQSYYAPDKRLKIGDTIATDENVQAAKSLIFDELLGEFCFADEASRANALALMLLPFVRPLIEGPTPLHLIDAPTEGSGKGLLADVLTVPFKPDGATLMTEGESDEEWRKRITAVLAEAPSHVMVDNISKRLESGSFAAVLTTKEWSDRLLGGNTIIKFPVTPVWIATGNNVEMSPEITRRTVWIRLRPAEEDPSQRTFKIENLHRWAFEHRSELVTACLTLIQKWADLKMPSGTARKGSYEDWAIIMSGIMDTIGVDGFLGNYVALGEKANQDNELWREFVSAWHTKYGTELVGVAELFLIASTVDDYDEYGKRIKIGQGLLDSLLRSSKEQGRKVKLGDYLKAQVDRVYGKYRIVRDGTSGNAVQYRLEPIGESNESQNIDSLQDSSPKKASNTKALRLKNESSESLIEVRTSVGGSDVSPPVKAIEERTDSSDSLEPVESVVLQDKTQNESLDKSRELDSLDSPAIPNKRYKSNNNMAFSNGESNFAGLTQNNQSETQLLKSLHDEFGSDPIPTQKMIRHAKTVGYDLTGDNHTHVMNMDIIASQIAGKELDGLKLHSSGDGEYAIATLKNEKAQRVEEVELL